MNKFIALAEKCECAPTSDTRLLLIEAFDLLDLDGSKPENRNFFSLLDAGGYVDAALKLWNGSNGSNKAGFLHTAMFQLHIGDIPDERIPLKLAFEVLRRQALRKKK